MSSIQSIVCCYLVYLERRTPQGEGIIPNKSRPVNIGVESEPSEPELMIAAVALWQTLLLLFGM